MIPLGWGGRGERRERERDREREKDLLIAHWWKAYNIYIHVATPTYLDLLYSNSMCKQSSIPTSIFKLTDRTGTERERERETQRGAFYHHAALPVFQLTCCSCQDSCWVCAQQCPSPWRCRRSSLLSPHAGSTWRHTNKCTSTILCLCYTCMCKCCWADALGANWSFMVTSFTFPASSEVYGSH